MTPGISRYDEELLRFAKRHNYNVDVCGVLIPPKDRRIYVEHVNQTWAAHFPGGSFDLGDAQQLLKDVMATIMELAELEDILVSATGVGR